jgi:hypothetical protein
MSANCVLFVLDTSAIGEGPSQLTDLPECSEPVGAIMTVSSLACNKYRVLCRHRDLAAERLRERAELLAATKRELATARVPG